MPLKATTEEHAPRPEYCTFPDCPGGRSLAEALRDADSAVRTGKSMLRWNVSFLALMLVVVGWLFQANRQDSREFFQTNAARIGSLEGRALETDKLLVRIEEWRKSVDTLASRVETGNSLLLRHLANEPIRLP
jgi:hypothetical protein